VAYFEDVISETRLFSTFTKQHEKMYGKKLPFYEISDDYLDDEINRQDILFLIWYYISIHKEKMLFDPYFINCHNIKKVVSRTYDLFDREFEKAPINEKLQEFLQFPVGSDVKTVREKFSFIVKKSLFWESAFSVFFEKILDKHKENGIVVLNERSQMGIYDQQVHFLFNECMPLLSMRVNEYFAELIGEQHPEYQFIKNISKRIIGNFLILKIEKDGFLIEHLGSKKQIWLSNEFTTLQNVKLTENKTVLSLGLVRWRDDVWQNQGACAVGSIGDFNEKSVLPNPFDDEKVKVEVVKKLEEAFLELTDNKRLIYVHGKQESAEFTLELYKKHAKIIDPAITEKKLNEMYEGFVENAKKTLPFEKNENIAVFFNPISGVEMFQEGVVNCLSDKNNPYYANDSFDLFNLILSGSISVEFVDYVIKNNIINLSLDGFNNKNMFNIIMDNLDFLLRFYRKNQYFSVPQITLKS
jgi:hypothetical protein